MWATSQTSQTAPAPVAQARGRRPSRLYVSLAWPDLQHSCLQRAFVCLCVCVSARVCAELLHSSFDRSISLAHVYTMGPAVLAFDLSSLGLQLTLLLLPLLASLLPPSTDHTRS